MHKYGGFTKLQFHVFDRYEIPIQAFLFVINGKFIIVRSSSPQNHFKKYISKKYTYKMDSKTYISKTHQTYFAKNDGYAFHDFRTFSNFQILRYENMF